MNLTEPLCQTTILPVGSEGLRHLLLKLKKPSFDQNRKRAINQTFRDTRRGLLLLVSIVADSQLVTTFCTAACEEFTTVLVAHFAAKTVLV